MPHAASLNKDAKVTNLNANVTHEVSAPRGNSNNYTHMMAKVWPRVIPPLSANHPLKNCGKNHVSTLCGSVNQHHLAKASLPEVWNILHFHVGVCKCTLLAKLARALATLRGC
eukprot:2778248-Amphidinium_carterae.1